MTEIYRVPRSVFWYVVFGMAVAVASLVSYWVERDEFYLFLGVIVFGWSLRGLIVYFRAWIVIREETIEVKVFTSRSMRFSDVIEIDWWKDGGNFVLRSINSEMTVPTHHFEFEQRGRIAKVLTHRCANATGRNWEKLCLNSCSPCDVPVDGNDETMLTRTRWLKWLLPAVLLCIVVGSFGVYMSGEWSGTWSLALLIPLLIGLILVTPKAGLRERRLHREEVSLACFIAGWFVCFPVGVGIGERLTASWNKGIQATVAIFYLVAAFWVLAVRIRRHSQRMVDVIVERKRRAIARWDEYLRS